MKGKLSVNPTWPTTTEDSLSTSSDLSGSDDICGKSKLNDSNSKGSDVEDEDKDFDVTRMTEGVA